MRARLFISACLAITAALPGCREACSLDVDCNLGERCTASGACATTGRPAFEALTGDTPTVLLTTPLPGESTPNVLTPVSALFARPVDPRSVNGLNFVVETEGGARPPGDVAVSLAPAQVIFVPRAALAPGRYTATIPSETRDALSGRARTVPYRWSFTVTSSP